MRPQRNRGMVLRFKHFQMGSWKDTIAKSYFFQKGITRVVGIVSGVPFDFLYQFHTNLITNPLPALLFETPCTTVILKAINTIFS